MEAKRHNKSSRPRKRPGVEPFRVPLDIKGVIRAAFGDETILVTANRDTIIVDLPRLRFALTVLKGAGGRAPRIKVIRRADALLRHAAQCMHVRLANRTVARLGAGVHPGLFSRALALLFGLGPLDTRPSVVTALIRSVRE